MPDQSVFKQLQEDNNSEFLIHFFGISCHKRLFFRRAEEGLIEMTNNHSPYRKLYFHYGLYSLLSLKRYCSLVSLEHELLHPCVNVSLDYLTIGMAEMMKK